MANTYRKGIILAGGTGSRLYPITNSISKQLLPIFDKPMIYYPISTLMLAGIKDILIITNPEHLSLFKKLLGNGNQWGINLYYKTQEKPNGIAEAYLIADKFLDGYPSVLILGDNIFFGNALRDKLLSADNKLEGATVFLYRVKDPKPFGVANFDENQKIINIEEKPKNPKSNFIITGLYYFDENAQRYSKDLNFSKRNELEIVDLLNIYIKKELVSSETLGRGFAWLDTGTPNNLIKASQFVQTIQERQGLKISCPEEIAYLQDWINSDQLDKLISKYKKNDYGEYLSSIK